jgi:hypothetical protein
VLKTLVIGASALTLLAGAAAAQDYDHDRYHHDRYEHRYDHDRGYYYHHHHHMRRVCHYRYHRRVCVTRSW